MSKLETIKNLLAKPSKKNNKFDALKKDIDIITSEVVTENRNMNGYNRKDIIEKGQKVLKDLKDQNGVVTYESNRGINKNRIIPSQLLNKFLIHPEIVVMEDKDALFKLRRQNEKITKAGIAEIQKHINTDH